MSVQEVYKGWEAYIYNQVCVLMREHIKHSFAEIMLMKLIAIFLPNTFFLGANSLVNSTLDVVMSKEPFTAL